MWRGSDSNAKMKPLVAWKKCSKPKRKGGLGIINLRSQNSTLLLKHLDKFYNRKEIPWVKLVWHAHYSNGDIPHATMDKGSFRGRISWNFVISSEESLIANSRMDLLFFSGQTFGMTMSCRASFQDFSLLPKTRRFMYCSSFQTTTSSHKFHLPLSQQAYQEYQRIQDYIQSIQVQ